MICFIIFKMEESNKAQQEQTLKHPQDSEILKVAYGSESDKVDSSDDDLNNSKSEEEDGSPVEEISIDEVINKVIKKLWEDNKPDENNELTKEDTQKFV